MDLEITRCGVQVLIASPKGRFDAMSAPGVREKFEKLLADGAANFVIDLTDTIFMDSAGMAVLVSLLKGARQAGGDVKLIWPGHEAASRILTLTRFDRVFSMIDSVETGIKSFRE